MKHHTLAPGPGTHDVNFKIDKRSSPRYGFGSSTRESGKKSTTLGPGPGAYRLPHSVGSVPDYSIPGRTDDVKYI